MILVRIYPFTRKDIKMKLDRIKKELEKQQRKTNAKQSIFIKG
ncbi:hypothetical protein CUPS4256_02960 [Campylobacter upsaliensis]|nr:hypothetical protein [Campylobacter upsaliensis]MCR2102216.1 hypothetical protein [Campylobacter upsaliensis]